MNVLSKGKIGIIQIVDLFCGAGGTSTGAIEAVHIMGKKARLTAVNHWPTAISTHLENHPGSRHYCTGIENVEPRKLFPKKTPGLLWASPECVHFSTARGGMPVSDQRRASGWCVVKWARHVRPPVICVENVPEYVTWGKLRQRRDNRTGRRAWQTPKIEPDKKKQRKDRTPLVPCVAPFSQRKNEHWPDYVKRLGRVKVYPIMEPDPEHKGKTFDKWVRRLQKLGYLIDKQVICTANFGDPTTRRRLFVQAIHLSQGRKPCWPLPTHAAPDKLGEIPVGYQAWVPARAIIDWKILGTSVYGRTRPLSPKTMKRIVTGFEKFWGPFLLPKLGVFQQNQAFSPDRPLNTVIGDGRVYLVRPSLRPYLVPSKGSGAREVERPLHTITTESRGERLIQPQLIPIDGEPYLVQFAHGNGKEKNGDNRRVRPLSKPMPAICGSMEWGICTAYVVTRDHLGSNGCCARSGNAPLSNVTTQQRHNLVQPILKPTFGEDAQDLKNRIIVEMDGQKYMVDFLFRPLNEHELALAQGFPADYRFSGTKSEVIKQIGNAVPRNTARAIVLAALTGNPDVRPLLEAGKAA
jgi:DNA (cytosine-5)-methyltransferase 1